MEMAGGRGNVLCLCVCAGWWLCVSVCVWGQGGGVEEIRQLWVGGAVRGRVLRGVLEACLMAGGGGVAL